MTEELGDSELPSGGSVSLFKVKYCGPLKFTPRPLCDLPHTGLPPRGLLLPVIAQQRGHFSQDDVHCDPQEPPSDDT